MKKWKELEMGGEFLAWLINESQIIILECKGT